LFVPEASLTHSWLDIFQPYYTPGRDKAKQHFDFSRCPSGCDRLFSQSSA